MADDEPDLLSQLPDELLHHILHLAPCREAQTTAVLSRRWRGLWPLPTCAAAVKIDMPYRHNYCRQDTAESITASITAAAAAHNGPVQRLAVHNADGGCWFDEHIAGVVLSHPAFGGVQDVRVGEADDDDGGSVTWTPMENVGAFEFSLFGAVPSAALRALHITDCRDLPPPPPSSSSSSSFFFPCLEVLRLRWCKVSLDRLQDMVVASPKLAALQLEYVYLAMTPVSSLGPTDVVSDSYYRWRYPQSLCCPSVTTVVIVNCSCENDRTAVELDAPRVQHFRFRGKIGQFTVRAPPMPELRRVYLHFLHCCHGSGYGETCESLWNFLKSFSDAKVLKLKLEWPVDHVAILSRNRIGCILGETYFNVEHLEIDAPHDPDRGDVGVAIGILLQCCPGVQDLRLKLTTAGDQQPRTRRRNGSTSFLQQISKAQLEFHKSMDHFRRRRENTVVPLCGDDEGKFQVSAIPGLSDRWFHLNCLQFHLKRLSLQFDMDKDNPNCVGVRLVKFFVERGLALEEMYIDDGNMKLWEHMNCKISGYAANPEPFPEYLVLERMSQALSMNQSPTSKISGWFQPHKLQVRRRHPWSTSRSFAILPMEISE